MALQTPRSRGLQRPSYGGTNVSPNLSASVSSAAVNRKASLVALTGDSDIYVGDAVNVPGNMYGVAKFVGSIPGKNGVFVGVELDNEFAARGKNSGDVDGVSYFETSVPGAGIFLPINRAERRLSPGLSPGTATTSPQTPYTPSYSTTNGQRTNTPPRSSQVHKFAQSVGPGARAPSPTFKPSRPSLPRPESPFRKQPPNLAPTPARPLSASQRGVRPGQTPSKTNLRASTKTPRPTNGATPRPYSRTGSRLGSRGEDSIAEDERTPVGNAITNGRTTSTGSGQPLRSPSRLGSAGGSDSEIQRLKNLLAERDQRLEEQAATLADMEKSVKELSNIIPQDAASAAAMSYGNEHDDANSAQLRQIVREKNEKISMLTAEFDTHRADFRSTLDSLEMASTETERVYEEQKRDLLARIAELEDLTQGKEDFEGVSRQLKALEDFVAEMEEGLEESRRGEAEARGEVEFLRGEVERGRAELRRERDKAAGAAQKDTEIRGLQHIIQNFNSSKPGASPTPDASASGSDAARVRELQEQLALSQSQREALEREMEQMRRDNAIEGFPNGTGGGAAHTRNESERTATGPISSSNTNNAATGTTASSSSNSRPRAETIRPAPLNPSSRRRAAAAADNNSNTNNNSSSTSINNDNISSTGATVASGGINANHATDGGPLFCEMCEATDHDTLDCSKIHSERDEPETYSDAPSTQVKPLNSGSSPTKQQQNHASPPLSYNSPGGPGKENENSAAGFNGKGGNNGSSNNTAAPAVDESKWCALCEKDGHLAFDCPEEQY